MKKYKWATIILFVLSAGCASTNETTVTMPNGDIYQVQSEKDSLVTFKQGDVELTSDRRGKMGIFENLMGILLMKTDFSLKNKAGD